MRVSLGRTKKTVDHDDGRQPALHAPKFLKTKTNRIQELTFQNWQYCFVDEENMTEKRANYCGNKMQIICNALASAKIDSQPSGESRTKLFVNVILNIFFSHLDDVGDV